MDIHTKDDVYAYALSKTLTKVSSPATVGLYSSCQDRITLILRQMEVHMSDEAARIEKEHTDKPEPRAPSLSAAGFLALIGRMIFFEPVWTEQNQQHHNIRFLFVHFSAWHFAGSDMLWAGLAMRLFQAVQRSFGKVKLVLYHVTQHDEEDEVERKKLEDSRSHWRSKKVFGVPIWLLLLCAVVIPVTILIALILLGFPDPKAAANSTTGHTHVVEGIAMAALGVPAVTALRFLFKMCKNFIFTHDLKIRRGMDNEKVSNKLGFMNEVRKEMWFLTQFVQFMEVFERRRIRVVLQITNLDRCSPMKIVAVLDAINILLSDEESPFISILAVNPEVLVQKVNFADGCFSKDDRAHALLNRIVTLTFTVPPLCDDSRRTLFHSLASSAKITKTSGFGFEKEQIGKICTSDLSLAEMTLDMSDRSPLVDKVINVNEGEVEMMVKQVLTNNNSKLNKYILDDCMSLRRVINSFRMAVIIMKALKMELPSSENIAAWVVIANLWPCRLSWIMQCVEDAKQKAQTNTNNSKMLWEVFSESKAELYIISVEIEEFLDQDDDPEMFERFLKEDFKFTIKDLETFETATVNLDHTIRNELAKIRGTTSLCETGWMKYLAPLPLTTMINMKTEDVCKELERMEFPTKYIEKVKNNDLSGFVLIFGDVEDLKRLLDMTFGEWATFKMHFLSSQSHQQNNNRILGSSFSRLPKCPLHGHQQHPCNNMPNQM